MRTEYQTIGAAMLLVGALNQAVASDATTLRGVMLPPDVTTNDIHFLGRQWNVNLVRFQIGGPCQEPEAAYPARLASKLSVLDSILPACAEVGIKVVIALMVPPGGCTACNPNGSCSSGSDHRIFREGWAKDSFITTWTNIARKYAGNPTVLGYDLLNEPHDSTVAPGLLSWAALADLVTRRIREIDADHFIIIEPRGGNPMEFPDMSPIDPAIQNIIYSVHMYFELKYTHQGIYGNPTNVPYGGKAEIESHLTRHVARHQDRLGRPIYIGEFSAARWAPSAEQYLADCIEVFEKHGWNWTYHAFREAPVWNVECLESLGEDVCNPAPSPTARELVLRGAFQRNCQVTDPIAGRWYVKGDFDGTETGTLSHPFSTIARALGAANPGDILTVFPGDYPETPLRIDKRLCIQKMDGPGRVRMGP